MNDFEYFEMMLKLALGVETIFEELEEALNKCNDGEKIGEAITDKFKKLHGRTIEQRKLLPETNVIPIECVILLDLRNAIEFTCKKKYVKEHDKTLLLDISKHIYRIFKNI